MAGAKGREGGRQVCVRALLIFLSDGDTLHWGDVEGGNERGASERAGFVAKFQQTNGQKWANGAELPTFWRPSRLTL